MPICVVWKLCFAVVGFMLNKRAAAFETASVISKMLPLAPVEYVAKNAHFSLFRTHKPCLSSGSFTESVEFLSLDKTAESLSLCKVIPWPSH